MIKQNIFVKIDTVFIYKINVNKLDLIEDEYFMYKEISSKQMEEYVILFENNVHKNIISKFRLNINLKKLIINNHINNFNIIDFSLYIHSMDDMDEDDNSSEYLKDYEKLENLYKDFIIHLNKFRKEQVLKYTFNINQRRISRKKLLEIKEDMQKEIRVNWKYEDIF